MLRRVLILVIVVIAVVATATTSYIYLAPSNAAKNTGKPPVTVISIPKGADYGQIRIAIGSATGSLGNGRSPCCRN